MHDADSRIAASRLKPAVLGALAAALSAGGAARAAPRIYPTGTTLYDPARAYNSFVCFSGPDAVTHLIDMNGHEVHRWPHPGLPGNVIDPALVGGAKGHVLLQLSDIQDPRGGIFGNRTVGELDWDGKVLWEWGAQAPTGGARQNHDWARLPNGNTLLLVTVLRKVPRLGPKELGDQGIYEVAPDGRLVWSWLAGDHLAELGSQGAGLRYLKEKVNRIPVEIWGYLEINDLQPLGKNRWHEAGDARFAPDTIPRAPFTSASGPTFALPSDENARSSTETEHERTSLKEWPVTRSEGTTSARGLLRFARQLSNVRAAASVEPA